VVADEQLRDLDADVAAGDIVEVLGAVAEDLGEGDGGEGEVRAAQTEGDATDRRSSNELCLSVVSIELNGCHSY